MTHPGLVIRSSPHWNDKDTVPRIMCRVLIALTPAVLASLYFFRLRAVLLYLVTATACLATEALFFWARKKPLSSLLDGSALITAVLLAMCLPPSLPLEMAAIGGVVASGIGKQVFGGLGHNIFNPALVGRAFLAAAFPAAMTTWMPPLTLTVDTATFATPLADLRFHDAVLRGTLASFQNLFLGNVGGTLGGTSALTLIIGGAYLLIRKTIDWRIPAGVIASISVFTGVFWLSAPDRYASPLFHVLSGGLLLGALFMATDYVTSPLTASAKWIYALGIGLVAGLIRLFGGYPEGIMYAILFMNMFVPLLETLLRPRILGEKGRAR
jgi:electron transport complex protein RnfD